MKIEQIRDLFNFAKDKSVEYAGIAVNKTKDATRVAKLTMELTAEKEAVKKSYVELGKNFYEENRATAQGLFAQLCEEIDAANAHINELQAEVDALRASLRKEGASFEDVVAEEEPEIVVEVEEVAAEEAAPEAPAAEEHTEE